jgi:hypothetical protein
MFVDSGNCVSEMAKPLPVKTRKQATCPVFGTPKDLPSNTQPTYEDVIQCYLFHMQTTRDKAKGKQPSLKEISEVISKTLEELWKKASIPSVSHERIVKMFQDYYQKYRNIMKTIKKPNMTDAFKLKLETFQEHANKTLFDISTCKCTSFYTCVCPRERKVPTREQAFLTDQRTERKMYISAVDIKTSIQLQLREERRIKTASRFRASAVETGATTSSAKQEVSDSNSQPSNSSSDSESDTEELVTGRKRKRSKSTSKQMRLSLPSLAKACDRTGVSNRGAAIIANAVLEDLQLITKEDRSNVIDKNKLYRERKKVRSDLSQKEREKVQVLEGLYFDGRKDTTIVIDKEKGKTVRKTIKEEHVVLLSEPGSTYLGHVSPTSGQSESIKCSIIDFLNEKDISTSELVAIGCDGTNINTGAKNGVIALIERDIGRPVQWLICQLHANELPLRHLLQNLDGPTSGPQGFTGPIGKHIKSSENLEVVEFAPIVVELPEINESITLSTDQTYLLDICHAVSSGHCPPNLARMNPGKLSHARWLTTANRILRYYVGCKEPSDNLKIIVEFIMKVYSKMWFTIRNKPYCTEGARNLWMTIKLSRYLSSDLKKIVDPVIKRNGYFGHPENILLSMISDTRPRVRKLGLRRIMKSREAKSTTIRRFEIPDFNFDAEDYIDLIEWQRCELTEPPMTSRISDEDLQQMVIDGDVPQMKRFPSHTQAVERCVKLVSEASSAVCGTDSRDGYIFSKLSSRNVMPSFNTKREYKTSADSAGSVEVIKDSSDE